MVGSEPHFSKPGVGRFFFHKGQRVSILGFVGQEENWGYHVGTYIEKTNFHKIFIDEIQNITTEYNYFFPMQVY